MAIKIIPSGSDSAIIEQAEWVTAQNFTHVLDVGGFRHHLYAATHMIDFGSYEHRRTDLGWGPKPERFTADTWIVRDVHDIPWPWSDNYFDYVWCSQIIEDIRDPLAVCREVMRVGRAGFVSTIHRSYESSTVQEDGVVGYHHHRWLIEAIEPNNVIFTFKSPILQVSRAFRPPMAKQWMLHWTWEGEFEVEERFVEGHLEQRQELQDYLRRVK